MYSVNNIYLYHVQVLFLLLLNKVDVNFVFQKFYHRLQILSVAENRKEVYCLSLLILTNYVTFFFHPQLALTSHSKLSGRMVTILDLRPKRLKFDSR